MIIIIKRLFNNSTNIFFFFKDLEGYHYHPLSCIHVIAFCFNFIVQNKTRIWVTKQINEISN